MVETSRLPYMGLRDSLAKSGSLCSINSTEGGVQITSIKPGSVVIVDIAKSTLPEQAQLRMGIVVDIVNPTAHVQNRYYKILVNQLTAPPKVYVFEWQWIGKVIQGGNVFELLKEFASSYDNT